MARLCLDFLSFLYLLILECRTVRSTRNIGNMFKGLKLSSTVYCGVALLSASTHEQYPSCERGACPCSRTTGRSPTCSRSLCQPRSLRMLGGETATHYARTKGTSCVETLKSRYALWYLKTGSEMLQQDWSKQYQANHQDVVHRFYLKSICWLKTSCQHWLKEST